MERMPAEEKRIDKILCAEDTFLCGGFGAKGGWGRW
jgi:hypothetical protein